jgi:hypothetical protein
MFHRSHLALLTAKLPQGPDGPKTLCNACGLSYAKETARREAAASASSTNAQTHSHLEPVSYSYSSSSTANSNHSRSGRGAGVKTLDGSSSALSTAEGTFPGPAAAGDAPLPAAQPVRECSVCRRTDSPQWRKVRWIRDLRVGQGCFAFTRCSRHCVRMLRNKQG